MSLDSSETDEAITVNSGKATFCRTCTEYLDFSFKISNGFT